MKKETLITTYSVCELRVPLIPDLPDCQSSPPAHNVRPLAANNSKKVKVGTRSDLCNSKHVIAMILFRTTLHGNVFLHLHN